MSESKQQLANSAAVSSWHQATDKASEIGCVFQYRYLWSDQAINAQSRVIGCSFTKILKLGVDHHKFLVYFRETGFLPIKEETRPRQAR